MINKKAIKFNNTFGLGGIVVLLIAMLFFTGLLLRFIYEPFPGKAYESIEHMQNNKLFGQLIRNIHYWSGMFALLISLLHLLRVMFTNAFHDERQFNWILGILLLITLILSNFTGYLLPWDQLSYWAVTIITNLLDYLPLIGVWLKNVIVGGEQVNASTLLFFYNIHTGILPILLIILMSFHFWRVRKAGGIIIKELNESEMLPTFPNLVAKEFVVALIVVAIIMLLSISFDAPLMDKANPNYSPNPAKAPWYFLGIQELILHFHPLFGAIIIPLMILTFIVLIPYFNYNSAATIDWFYSKKGKSLALISLILGCSLSMIFILLNEYLLDFSGWFKFLPSEISNGLIPTGILCVLLYIYYKYLILKRKANKNEIVLALFVLICSSFLVLTLTGILLRGKGMALIF